MERAVEDRLQVLDGTDIALGTERLCSWADMVTRNDA